MGDRVVLACSHHSVCRTEERTTPCDMLGHLPVCTIWPVDETITPCEHGRVLLPDWGQKRAVLDTSLQHRPLTWKVPL
eukprot:6125600-Prymnesium_polylepis.1